MKLAVKVVLITDILCNFGFQFKHPYELDDGIILEFYMWKLFI